MADKIDKLHKLVTALLLLICIAMILVAIVDKATCAEWQVVPGEMRSVGGCRDRCEPVKRCVRRRPWT